MHYLKLIILSLACIVSTNCFCQGYFDPSSGVFSFAYDPCEDGCSGATQFDCDRFANHDPAVCREECDQAFPSRDRQWLACVRDCDEPAPVSVVRTPVAFVAVFVITSDINDPSKYRYFNIPQRNSSSPTFTINTGRTWSSVLVYCWAYNVRILYNDGTICDIGSGWACSA